MFKNDNERKINFYTIVKFFVFLITIFFIIQLFAGFVLQNNQAENPFFISPIARKIINNAVSFINSRDNSKNLEKIVLNRLGNNTDDFGIVIFNLNTGEKYYLNENKQFETASLYKLWVMASVYNQLDKGLIKKDDLLSGSLDEFNSQYSTDSAQVRDISIPWSVEDALTNMITISDNYSAYLLIKKISLHSVTDFLAENGFDNSRLGYSVANPLSTPKDIALFFQRLYRSNLADKNSTNEMLDLLREQRVNTKLTFKLPQNLIVAHKTGELNKYSHDGGIIYSPKGDFIIVVMSNTANPQDANNKIAEISLEVYNYFSR